MCLCPSPAEPVRSSLLRDKNNSSFTRNSTDSSPCGARSSIVMYEHPLLSFATFSITTFTSPEHFSLDKSSVGVYTSFHISAESSGLLEGSALIFFLLQASGNKKSNVCAAATFQLMKRGSIPSLHFSILFSASRAAPMRGAMMGDVTPNNILLRWISRALVRQRPGPRKTCLLVLFRVFIGLW